MSKEFDYFFKIAIIGDSGTGKSNFLKRLSPTLTYEWDDTFKPTIGVDFSIFYSSVDQNTIKLLIWDTAGSPRFWNGIPSKLRGMYGFLIVYDITKRETFENVRNWVEEAKGSAADSDATMVLVGNKSDLEDEREVSYEEGSLLAEEYGMKFVETSVKRNENIHYIAKWLMRNEREKAIEKGRIEEKYLSENQKGKGSLSVSKCFSS